MISLRQILTTGFMLLVAGLVVACAAGSQSTQVAEANRVNLQLNWTHEGEFAGYYVADAKGFYEEEDLEVTINAGGIDIVEEEVLLNKEADFAVLAMVEYLSGIEMGGDFSAVAAVFQIPPSVFFSLAGSGIHSPQDFVGKRIAIKTEGWRDILEDMAASADADLERITQVDVNFDEMERLYKGDVDVWSGYVHDEITQARLDGYEVNLIFPYEYGIGNYEGLLVARQEMIEKEPELVARFLRASQRGWQYAVEHPGETAEIIAQWQPEQDIEFHKIAFEALVPLVDTGEVPIGWIDEDRWQLATAGAGASSTLDYTMQFLEAND